MKEKQHQQHQQQPEPRCERCVRSRSEDRRWSNLAKLTLVLIGISSLVVGGIQRPPRSTSGQGNFAHRLQSTEMGCGWRFFCVHPCLCDRLLLYSVVLYMLILAFVASAVYEPPSSSWTLVDSRCLPCRRSRRQCSEFHTCGGSAQWGIDTLYLYCTWKCWA